MKRLNLSVRESTIETAKQLAAESGTSVSAKFERIVLLLAFRKNQHQSSIGPATRKATGLVELTGDMNGRDVLEAALLEKYGLVPRRSNR